MESKAGSRWDQKEIDNLKKELEEGKSWLDISNKHGRSILSVQMKAVSEHLKDKEENNMEEKNEKDYISALSKKLGVGIELVQSIYYKKEKGKEDKEKNNNKDSFKLLWDFKIFLMEKYEFGDDTQYIHEVFDEFVKKI